MHTNHNTPFFPYCSAMVLAGGMLIGASVSPSVHAQTLALEEVVVTATKRETNLQDVAVAVTALSADFLKEAHIQSSEDLTHLVPSLNLQKGSNPRQTSFSIRGIGTQSFSSAAEPSVSSMLDGVVMGRSAQSFMQLLDVQRVEVLRGPQGTLFGKNSTGGVVHIITQNPTSEHSGEIMASVISDEEYRGGLSVAGPLSDTVGYRFSAVGGTTEGYTRNVFDGSDLDGIDTWNVRGKLRWEPSDTLEFKFASDYGKRSCECTTAPLRSIDLFESADGSISNADDIPELLALIDPITPSFENQTVSIDKRPFSDSASWGSSMEANWDVGEFTLTSITASRGFEVNGFGDVDNLPVTRLGFDQFGSSEQEQFTQEFRITSPADRQLTYVAGVFYFDQEVKRTFRRQFEIVPGDPGIGIASMAVDTRNWAAFGELTWNFSDSMRILFGARYTEDELEFLFSRTQEGLQLGVPAAVPATPGATDETDLSGKVALQWDFNDAGMAYLSFTQGYKGPAYDVAFGTDPVGLLRVEPETSDSWELGIKTSLLDDRVRLNAAIFHSVYDDFQAQAFFDPDGVPDCPDDDPNCEPDNEPGSFKLINAGEVSTQGVELDFLAQVSKNLRLSGGLAFIDAKIDDYPAGQCSGGQTFRGECPLGLQDISGGDLPYSPDWKVSLTAAYTQKLGNGFDVLYKASVRAQDDTQYSLSQDENTIGESYAIIDASLVLKSHSDHWETSLFVKNVADEFYVTAIQANNAAFLPNGYAHRYSKLSRRTFGMELRYRWF